VVCLARELLGPEAFKVGDGHDGAGSGFDHRQIRGGTRFLVLFSVRSSKSCSKIFGYDDDGD